MRLYAVCRYCNNRIYLQSTAQARNQLPTFFSLVCPRCKNGSEYSRQEVIAEATAGGSIGGAVVGGIVGLLGGPLGLIVGTIIGGGAGAAADNSDARRVRQFNEEQA